MKIGFPMHNFHILPPIVKLFGTYVHHNKQCAGYITQICMPLVKVTGHGQMENLFTEHTFHTLSSTFISLSKIVYHNQTMCHGYKSGLHVRGQGRRLRSNGNVLGKFISEYNFPIICLIFILNSTSVYHIIMRHIRDSGTGEGLVPVECI